ncbi:MAG: 3-dehydroquinate synthase [Pirellula sp.]|jgi:3-dehydroquinate synthase|nr:3-dehydroquinate synthase [Pirellula sp.]
MSSIPWSIAQDSLNVNFSVPQTMRLRFTSDCFGADWDQVLSLFATDTDKSRVQFWIDQGVVAANPDIRNELERRLISSSDRLELTSPLHFVQGGEQVKNDDATIDKIFRQIDQDGLDRRSYLCVIGGGALLDGVGYAAGIAHRGIRLVRFPTTTLAQADSGVGVKNAINAYGKKNWKGTFAVPWAVVNDQSLIRNLPQRDFVAGFSEAVKVSLLKSPGAFRFLCEHAKAIAERQWDAVMTAIRSSVLMHLHHITHGGDPFEVQEARPLDFGHWSAHKLEHLTQFRLRHGEAVSIGVALDVVYSNLVHGLDRSDMLATLRALEDMGLPIFDAAVESGAIFDGLEEFRQHLGGRLTLTMLRGVGNSINVHEIDRMAMLEAIRFLQDRATRPSQVAP